MSHRSNLFLVACLTCFGVVPVLAARPAIGGVAALESTSAFANNLNSHVRPLPHDRRDESLVLAQVPAAKPSPKPAGQSLSPQQQSILLLGSQGAKVSELQTLLKQLGYYDHSVDGIFGDRTKQAVVEFQRQMDLPVDGQAGSSTFKRLTEVARKAPSGPNSGAGSVAASVVESPVAVETSATAETPPPRKGLLWWVLALSLAASTLAGVFFYELKRSKKRLSIQKPTPSTVSPGAATVVNSVKSAVVDPIESPNVSVDPPYTNGTPPNAGAIVLEKELGNHANHSTLASDTTVLSETTRLTKANLAEELVLDLHHPDPGRRRKAIWDLGQHGNSEAIQPLVDLMMDSDSSQRSLILAAISEIGIRTLKPMNRALIISLQDRSADVRKNAIRDVTRIYDQIAQVSQLLAHAASDPDSEVQETARWALGQLNRIRGLPDGTIASLPDQPKPPEQLPDASS
jgi:peptidoglycan hydrolase-like protein with peptidoglycan-binding domain